ncbi:mandelate racemase/muconate lactonizing enzyme family protein [Streptomyces sp. HNM0575]|uniref:mandelate racemase/muconate lactonizing enzyme family protein n=1 Tax=Streptomyces sp. HNM0575 TaxID=2716338 RepID=UPI00145D333A|nr:mandelate racemase/muconate lactonizing enzyme family protein [Streptomyces sp. HNM0575]NLU74388.1 mandelate racemase/muconate lactonizing enzyme family protein [Streptomyces sp. HNM0575]
MRIAGIRSRVVQLPLDRPFQPAWGRGRVQRSLVLVLLEVGTDDGLVGHGAAHGGLEAAVALDRFVTPHLLGQDPAQVDRLAAVIRDAEILGPPPYCMEIPLWDILGKAAGMPVHRLWGGAGDRVRAYCSTGELRPARQRAEDVAALADAGFTAVKLRFHHDDPREDLAVAEAVREKAGDRIELMADANQAGADPGTGGHRVWDFRTALGVARELERLGFHWLEEPLPRHDLDGLSRLRDRLETIKLAGGEDNHGLHEFRLLLERGCFDVLQPDAVKSETASAIRKLAAFAELGGVDVVPHTWGNGLGMLVHLHLAASLTNCGYLEFPHDPPSGLTASARDRMLTEPVTVDEEGFVQVPQRPGFGFVLDEERIAHHTVHVIEQGDCGFAREDRGVSKGSAT